MSSAKSWTARALVAATLGAGAVVSVAPVEAASSMVVAYGFDAAGASVADASGNGVTGTASGTQLGTGRHGSGFVFNGSSSSVVSNQPIALGTAFTVMAWLSNPAGSGYETIAAVGTSRDVFLSGSTLGFFDGTRDVTFGTVPTGRWVHVAITSDGAVVRAFVDGAPIGSAAAALGAVTARLQVGSWPSSGGASDDYFSGSIDEVRVYPRALTAAEISTDANQPLGSGSSPTTTTTAAPTTTVAPSTTTTVAPTTTTAPPSTTTTTVPAGSGSSLRTFGNGTGGIDRVRIPLTPSRAVNVGNDLTLEWWMKASTPVVGGACGQYNNSWIYGNIILDRDVYGPGDRGDYGVSLFGQGGGRIAFGVSQGSSGTTLCSTVGVADGAWHHVAVTRSASSGAMAIYIDGQQRGSTTGPTGDISYRDGRSTGYANDPYLVIGAEKHDAGSEFPSYSGWIDELRISSTVRYTSSFTAPRAQLPVDGATAALYHFNETSGTVAVDASGGDNGTLMVGGSPVGPVRSTDRPF